MKKTLNILALGALGAVVMFTGCKDDDPDPTVKTIIENTAVAYNQPTVAATVETTGTWLASSSAAWCVLPDDWYYGGKDGATINFEVETNKYVPAAARTSTISFTSTLNGKFQKVDVTQEALPATVDVIQFVADANFKAYCTEEFGASMNYTQAAAVTELDLSGQEVTELSWGLEYFTGLTSLNVSGNAALAALEFMNNYNRSVVICPSLESIDITDTAIGNLDISQLPNLTTLKANPSSLTSLVVPADFDTENLPAGFDLPEGVTITAAEAE